MVPSSLARETEFRPPDSAGSTIVEYDLGGNVVWIYSVKGHNDGLKVNPRRHHLSSELENRSLTWFRPVELEMEWAACEGNSRSG
jgi:hypothetical protein